MTSVVANTFHGWIVDLETIKHVSRDRGELIDYRRVSVGTMNLFIGNTTKGDMKGVGSYQFKLHSGHTLVIYDILSVPYIQHNILSIVATRLIFTFSFKAIS